MSKPTIRDAYRLFHEGCQALAVIESNGIRIDVDRLDRTIEETAEKIKGLKADLKKDEVWRIWRRRFGEKASLGSRQQLGKVLFDEMGHEAKSRTKKKGLAKVNEEVLTELDLDFTRNYRRMMKLDKLLGTYLKGLRSEVVDGLLHPVFNLHLARTFRSSSSNPNFQNVPIRDPEIGKLIRSCFIPRDGHVLVEVDFSALEFRVCACFWKCDAMGAYASDPTKDIHRDMAAECYMLDKVLKDVRFYAKNQFVFPELYGSYYVNCARNLWDAIDAGGLETAAGDPLKQHLFEEGIEELGECDSREKPKKGTFEKHIKKVEENFNEMFPQWSKRKHEWWKKYQERGRFRTMTGFECSGVMSRNDVYNYPIQGPAFHLLLWSLIRLVRQISKKKMKTKVVGQIHDSILADVPENELDDYLAMAKQIMTVDVRKHWKWVIVPLEIEAEVAKTNWYQKETVAC